MINIDEIMRDFDDEKHADRFCHKMNCYICNGTDFYGEPNGYGCREQDDYIKVRYNSVLKRRLKKIKKTFKDV